jgi:hypothetical protein
VKTILGALEPWHGKSDPQAVFWTDLQGKLAEDAPKLAGYSHSVNRQAIEHIKKEHGNENTEKSRGQIAVTGNDISRIISIVTNYDAIQDNIRSPRTGEPMVAYAKRFPGWGNCLCGRRDEQAP